MKQEGKVQTIATKVTIETKAKLNRIAQRWGMSFYELLQALLLALVRASDDTRTSLTSEHETMLQAFFNTIRATDGSFNPISIKGRLNESCDGALLFVGRQKRMRPQLLAVTKDGSGNLREHWNHDKMLSDFLNATDPTAATILQREAERHGHFSMMTYLHEIILRDSTSPDAMMKSDIDEMFSDIRIPSGEKVSDGDVLYKQRYNKGDYTAITPHRYVRHADLWG